MAPDEVANWSGGLGAGLAPSERGTGCRADPNLLLGLESPDDAGVYRLTPDLALVQTVDFFTPIVDDPYAWGAIAAANSMSDVYAMGAQPLLALNLVGLATGTGADLLASVIQAAPTRLPREVSWSSAGHTIDDPEPKYGMAVTGTVRPDRVVRTTGARPGMPTGPDKAALHGRDLHRAEAWRCLAGIDRAGYGDHGKRSTSRRPKPWSRWGRGAATDVTGFGLIGHLHDMLRGGSGSPAVGAEIWAERFPILDGVAELIAQGFVPGGTPEE